MKKVIKTALEIYLADENIINHGTAVCKAIHNLNIPPNLFGVEEIDDMSHTVKLAATASTKAQEEYRERWIAHVHEVNTIKMQFMGFGDDADIKRVNDAVKEICVLIDKASKNVRR